LALAFHFTIETGDAVATILAVGMLVPAASQADEDA